MMRSSSLSFCRRCFYWLFWDCAFVVNASVLALDLVDDLFTAGVAPQGLLISCSSFIGLSLHDNICFGSVVGWSFPINADCFAYGGKKGEGIIFR